MRRLIACCVTALISLSAPTLADEQDVRPVVVELFTSQGCSSCPPADAFLASLAPRDDVIALALHVDYWDYIGWKDEFAQSRFTKRQKSYARHAHRRSVYTPQMIVNGVEHVVGNHQVDVGDLIGKHANAPGPVALDLRRQGDQVLIRADVDHPLPGPVWVQLVRYIPERTVKIRSGENAGRELLYTNIVSDWQRLTDWDTRRPLNIAASVSGDEPVVVIVQVPGPGPILTAARLR